MFVTDKDGGAAPMIGGGTGATASASPPGRSSHLSRLAVLHSYEFSSLPVPSKGRSSVVRELTSAAKRSTAILSLPVPPRVDPATDRVEPPEAPRSRPKRALDVLSESPARSDQTETPSARVIQPLQRQRQPSTGLTAAEATPERTVDLPGSVSEPFEPPRNAQEARSAGDVLRRIEAGEGPGLEIAWPSDPASRLHLTRLLSRCHGMATILMGEEGGWNLESADRHGGLCQRFTVASSGPWNHTSAGPGIHCRASATRNSDSARSPGLHATRTSLF